MPDETKTNVVARRRSGEGHLFLNRAKLAAQKIRTEAASKKAAAIAAAHTEAQATFAAARTTALGMSLEKIVMLVSFNVSRSGLHLVEFAPDGSMPRPPVPIPAFMYQQGVVDHGAQRLYFARSAQTQAYSTTNIIGYMSLADYSSGTLVEFPKKIIGVIAFDPEQRKIYAPNEAGGIYVVHVADNSFSEIGPIPNVMLQQAIAVDPVHQKIYCKAWLGPEAPVNNFLIINYDGSDIKRVSIPNGQVGSNDYISSIDIDPVAGFVYGHGPKSIWRAPLDLSKITLIASLDINIPGRIDAIAIDRSTHLLYWGKGTFEIQRGSHRSLYRSITDGDVQPTLMFELPYKHLDVDMVVTISLLTSSEEARDKLVFEKSRKAEAPRLAAKKVADAHPEADKIRQIAHGRLEDAHKTAEETINKKKSEAAEQRLTAQKDAREKAEQAAAAKAKALADAEAKKKKAHEDAEAHLAQKQREADDITGPAKANLDAKRQELQNS